MDDVQKAKLPSRLALSALIVALVAVSLLTNTSISYASTSNTFSAKHPATLYQIDESGWSGTSQSSDAVNGWGDDQWNLTLSERRSVSIEVVDCCIVGDNYVVYVDGKIIGITPPEPLNGSTPSQGTFTTTLSDGSHLIKVRDPGAVKYYQEGNTSMIPAGYSVSITTSPNPAILSVTTSVTSKTPLWKIDAQVAFDPEKVSCPASLTVTIGNMDATQDDVCDGKTQAPDQTDVFVPVFDGQDQLTPRTSVLLDAQLTDADSDQSSLDSTADVPPAPVWTGLGDSFSSGHRQLKNERHCLLETSFCDVIPNNPSFSWITRAVNQLNTQLSVPHDWLMTAEIDARSGYTTSQIVSKQISEMQKQLAAHKGSWNIMSMTGGANDTDFSSELAGFYLNRYNWDHSLEPWDITDPARCVDTQAIWEELQKESNLILKNLKLIASDALKSDEHVRIADVDYPYVLDESNICAQNRTSKGKEIHGTTVIINELASLHEQVGGSHVFHIDLRKIFGTSPLGDIQEDALFGYPHPNNAGQQAIADAVVNRILGS